MDQAPLERSIGHHFANRELLRRALTHRSHSAPHNERLEFLGDSVLNCVIADELYRRYPNLSEGELSRARAALVNQNSLHQAALRLGLGGHIVLGEGEQKSGGARRPSILADALESLVGAIFVDGGMDAARSVVARLWQEPLERGDLPDMGKDAKTQLQEYLQARRIPLPRYSILKTEGVAHEQVFCVECDIPELQVRSTGEGSSRRGAEQVAARRAFELVCRE